MVDFGVLVPFAQANLGKISRNTVGCWDLESGRRRGRGAAGFGGSAGMGEGGGGNFKISQWLSPRACLHVTMV